MTKSVGVDLGGTEIKIGFFNNDVLFKNVSIKTNMKNSGEFIVKEIIDVINLNVPAKELKHIGIAVPGPVVKGVIFGAHNLGWETKNLKTEFKSEFPNTKISVLNDANAACLAEFDLIDNKYTNILLITLGTGIGAGIIIDKKLYSGSSGAAGEFGHIKVADGNKRLCNCGLYDCVERYSSATGIQISATEGGLSALLSCKEIFELAEQGNKIAIQAIDIMVEKLAIALASTANILNPDCIVIGGGVSKSSDLFLEKLKKEFNEKTFRTNKNVAFNIANLGNDAGMVGANLAAKNNYE